MNFFKQLLEQKKAVFGLAILLGFVLVSFVGPFVVRDPTEFLAEPLQPPSFEYFLGTTAKGQDVFAQTVAGARTSLLIGFSVGVAVVFIGAAVGIAAGFLGGQRGPFRN